MEAGKTVAALPQKARDVECAAGSFDFSREIEAYSGENLGLCFQCDKCAVGCPMAEHMEYAPNELFRLIQLGDRAGVLSSNSFWFCISCYTCSVRCPNGIDIAHAMDSLRELSLQAGQAPALPQARDFHKLFLGCVRRFGRVGELELMALYNLQRKRPFERLALGWALLRKGRLELWPHGRRGLGKLFRRVEESR